MLNISNQIDRYLKKNKKKTDAFHIKALKLPRLGLIAKTFPKNVNNMTTIYLEIIIKQSHYKIILN